MANDVVRLAVDLAIHDGKLADFERLAQTMSAGTEKESGARSYAWYLSADRKRCRLIEVYADAKAAWAHLSGPVVRELVPQLLKTANVTGFEVYGDPGPEATALLSGFGAEIFGPWQGFSR